MSFLKYTKRTKLLWVTLLILVSSLGILNAKKPFFDILDFAEEQHLIFMREEEKLARDVYIVLGELFPAYSVFTTINDAEQRHFDTMGEKLDQYGIKDPSTKNCVGCFTGEEYGEYFTDKFETLVSQGKENSLEALYVGALIEELDMHDIVYCPKAIVEADNGIEEGGCGLDYTDEKALERSYESLLEGSKDHLRAFVRQIEEVIGEGNYVAQYLSQDEVDDILGR